MQSELEAIKAYVERYGQDAWIEHCGAKHPVLNQRAMRDDDDE